MTSLEGIMSVRDFLMNIGFILAVMAVGAVLEIVVPFFAARGDSHRRSANLAFTALSFLTNWALASAAAVLALTLRPAGLLSVTAWSPTVRIVLGVVLLDFSIGYLSHRTLHMSSFLWRFHRIHHCDDFVDVTTTYRTHPVETFWRFLFSVVPVWLVGIPAQAVIIQRLLQSTFGVIEHSNIRLPRSVDRILSIVLVTPNLHKVHHSRLLAETNSNYANVLTLWDRLLGTFTPSERAYTVVYGLNDANPAQVASFAALLAMPFEVAETVSVPDTKVRNRAPAAQ
jgi:sterol desaturase/sphingolipid hydroxylase (fatty acid hydroxylase superfamily)